jgi:hypothetical protein
MASSIIIKCDEVLSELSRFSKEILTLGEPIDDDRLKDLEAIIGYKLPIDFTYILNRHNSFSLLGSEVYGLDPSLKEASLDKVYRFEHEEVENSMLKELFPFSPDGGGNHYCFDLSKLENGLCPVVFWQHDFSYPDKEDLEICNENFVDWMEEVMIAWTLEDINYDGSSKT